MHKHIVESKDKDGKPLTTEYEFVPPDVLGNVGYRDEPNWCVPLA